MRAPWRDERYYVQANTSTGHLDHPKCYHINYLISNYCTIKSKLNKKLYRVKYFVVFTLPIFISY